MTSSRTVLARAAAGVTLMLSIILASPNPASAAPQWCVRLVGRVPHVATVLTICPRPRIYPPRS